MDAVDDVTVMRVLLFVLHVCMLRVLGVEGDGNAGVGAGGGVVVVSVWCEYMGGTCDSDLCLLPTTC